MISIVCTKKWIAGRNRDSPYITKDNLRLAHREADVDHSRFMLGVESQCLISAF